MTCPKHPDPRGGSCEFTVCGLCVLCGRQLTEQEIDEIVQLALPTWRPMK